MPPGGPLIIAIGQGRISDVKRILERNKALINRTDADAGVTPLMTTAFCQNETAAVEIAELLLRNGADVNRPDTSGPAVTPLQMAAQEGRPRLVQLFVDAGGKIEYHSPRSPTVAIQSAVQNQHTECVAILARAAVAQDKVDLLAVARNKYGKSCCNMAVSGGMAEILGVLAAAGADLRRASPAFYVYGPFDGGSNVDTTPSMPVQHAMDVAVRSHVSGSCAECREFQNPDHRLLKCSRCGLANFCNAECQQKNWKSHKRCCKTIHAGVQLYGGEAARIPPPNREPYGFVEEYKPVDHEYDGHEDDVYDLDTVPIWEYDSGEPGPNRWQRYPIRIESLAENMTELGSPRAMYRPGDSDADGRYEEDLSRNPPRGVATRYIMFEEMVEREIYTGSSRLVRRREQR